MIFVWLIFHYSTIYGKSTGNIAHKYGLENLLHEKMYNEHLDDSQNFLLQECVLESLTKGELREKAVFVPMLIN